MEGDHTAHLIARTVFFVSAFAYLGVSSVDFWEHFRLERQRTGRWLAMQAVPVGESINHALTGLVLAAALLWVGPVSPSLNPRDWLTLTAPILFLGLGWWDELHYHRKRCVHREDMMHTVSHLAGGAMMTGLYLMRLLP